MPISLIAPSLLPDMYTDVIAKIKIHTEIKMEKLNTKNFFVFLIIVIPLLYKILSLFDIRSIQYSRAHKIPYAASQVTKPRPPALCQGCGHRDVYAALNGVLDEYDSPKVFGDIGCYTLGFLSPFNAIDTCVDMGASITMAKGAADAGQHPAVAIIGDSTFTHSGMTGLLDAINENTPMTVIISDNLTTGMTGGQDP